MFAFFFFLILACIFSPNTTHREIDVLGNSAGKCCFCHSGSLSRSSPSGQNTAQSLILEGWSRRTDCVTRRRDGGIKMQRGDIFRAVMWRGPLTLAATFPDCGRKAGGGDLDPASLCHPFLISTAGPEAGSGAYPNFAHVHRSEQDSGTLSLQFLPKPWNGVSLWQHPQTLEEKRVSAASQQPFRMFCIFLEATGKEAEGGEGEGGGGGAKCVRLLDRRGFFTRWHVSLIRRYTICTGAIQGSKF